MNLLWRDIIKPLFEIVNVRNIVEVGAQKGINTKKILEYISGLNGMLYSIDPAPNFEVEEWEKLYGENFVFYKELSLSSLPLIEGYDAILLDGDHNWYTIYNELKIVEKTFENYDEFPLILIHDVGWPYGRRDLYYNPDNIPLAYQLPYKKMGVKPESLQLVEGGFNAHLNNAVYENSPQNGVLTAVEDFVKECPIDLHFDILEGFHGLGIIYPNNSASKAVKDFIKDQNISDFYIRNLEIERINKHIENDNLKKELLKTKQTLKEIKSSLSNEKESLLNGSEQKLIKTVENIESAIEQIKDDSQQNLIESIEGFKDSYELQLENTKKELGERTRELSAIKELFENTMKRVEEELDNREETDRRFEEKKRELEECKINISREMNSLKKAIDDSNYKLKEAEIAATVHLNSFRYRLGDILISALRPSKNTVLAPIKITKLLVEGLKYKKKRIIVEEMNKPIYRDESSKVVNNLSRDDIVNRHEQETSFKTLINQPLVSILVLNKDGEKHLQRLFTSIIKNTLYKNFEIIVVDNNSNDNSLQVIKEFSEQLSIKLIENNYNASFSEANNQAASIANGEYLLLLNNDMEPLKNWLTEMMWVVLNHDNVGAVGSKLIYSEQETNSLNKKFELKMQHRGISFVQEDDFITPYNLGKGEDPFSSTSKVLSERAALTAACLLIKKDIYVEIGGLDEGFVYGYEDVDLGLKVYSKGYKNLYCPTSVLFHHEFGTQKQNKRKDVRDRRINNRKLIKKKWYRYLENQIHLDKLNNKRLFCEHSLKIAIAVTETGENATAGDYFTGMELGNSLVKRGYHVYYVARRDKNKSWYKLDDNTDVVISLLEAYNPKNIVCANKKITKIAWMRNWFDRWIDSSGFEHYDILLASSKIACDFIQDKTNKKAHLLPIATNPERFSQGTYSDELSCDYCFTGSYWNDPREIIDILDPSKIKYKFKVFGKNWDKVSTLRKYHQGFLNYLDIPNLYKSTKIVLDDANRVTKPYGSVNSRVFDALASGALVLTNGFLGAQETFGGELPTYSNSNELKEKLVYYLDNEDERTKKVNELRRFVLENHTYDNRAEEITEILTSHFKKYTVSIKVPAPKWETVHEWGDYHMALGLKSELQKLGHIVIIQILPEWDNDEDSTCDIVIVLRGLSKYSPKNHHFNIMWNISHPDKVSLDEYNQYDHVFISSKKWTDEIKRQVKVPVEYMLQCTDTSLFHKDVDEDCKTDLLFVGNSRKIYRKIISDYLNVRNQIAVTTNKNNANLSLSVYGTLWDGIIDDDYIKGNHIPNKQLHKYYSSCKILLNDHWDDMRDKGFISNRIFDGLACEAFIISDSVHGLEEEFGDSVTTYNSSEELLEIIDQYAQNPQKFIEKAKHGSKIVREKHTFKNRVDQILSVIK